MSYWYQVIPMGLSPIWLISTLNKLMVGIVEFVAGRGAYAHIQVISGHVSVSIAGKE